MQWEPQTDAVCLSVQILLLWAIHYFKLSGLNATAKPVHENTVLAFMIWTWGHHLVSVASSWALVSLCSLNSYSNSHIPARWDLLWWPNSSAFIPNERQPVPVFWCGPSAVCPLVDGGRESAQPPLSPPEGQLHRTGSHGELLMIHMMAWASHCLGYITQSGTNNRLQCHLIMAQKANLTDLHSSQG